MKKVKAVSLILFFSLLVLVGNCWAQQHQAGAKWKKVYEFNVGKFSLGEAALDKGMEDEIRRQMAHVPGTGNSRVLVFGYTDSSGMLNRNRILAKLRAQEVAQEMNSIKPALKFKCIANPYEKSGDTNYRMVRVEVYVPVQEVQKQQKSWKQSFFSLGEKIEKLKNLFFSLGLFLIVLVVLILFVAIFVLVVFYFSRRNQQRDNKHINKKLEKVDQSVKDESYGVKNHIDQQIDQQNKEFKEEIDKVRQEVKVFQEYWINIGEYQIKILFKEGYYYSPFVSEKSGNVICRKNWGDIRKSLKNGIKGKFDDQIEGLVKEGKIEIKKDKGEKS